MSPAIKDNNSGKVKKHVEYEFGGPIGVLSLMIWSHYILIYFWYCLNTNGGSLIIPTSVDEVVFHAKSAWELILATAIPSYTTWVVYALFFFVQLVLASFMPGITMYGVPTKPHGVRLEYLCNGYSCYYLCLFGALLVHFTDIFKLTYIVDHHGEFLIASIIIGDVTSVMWYFYGLAVADEDNGASVRTGNFFYDLFMGTILYPRLGIVDIKMIAESRWSWVTLMMITLSAALKQYETTGDISPQMLFMLFAHWIYSNATAKGEHCIPGTWDMFHENFGWMLNFWNVSGVPFLYTFQSLYILKNQDMITANYPWLLVPFNYTLLIVGYYIFDSANLQKATIKIKVVRNTFPQVPWGVLEEPVRYIETPKGNLLIDGWYAFGRKMQYTGDIMMALSWGLACGFHSFMPYFFALFFTCMINHRQIRDEVRCKEKYGKYWDLYTKTVPNVFFPSFAFYKWLLTGVHPLDDNFELRREIEALNGPSVTISDTPSYASAPTSPAPTPTPKKTAASRSKKVVENGDASPAAVSKPRSTTPSKARSTTPSKSRSTTPSKRRSSVAAAAEVSVDVATETPSATPVRRGRPSLASRKVVA